MPPSDCCRSPGDHGAQEKSRGDRKSENDSTAAGASNRHPSVCDSCIGTLFGFRRRKASCRSHHLSEVAAIIIGHTGVTRRS